MSKDFDAIIEGGGLASLTCGAYLFRYAFRTLLCEKSKKTGGLVNKFLYRGYAFDGGIRASDYFGILLRMLKSPGLNMEFVKVPIEEVFQCEQWSFSPSGLPVSILSRKLAVDAIRPTLKGSGS